MDTTHPQQTEDPALTHLLPLTLQALLEINEYKKSGRVLSDKNKKSWIEHIKQSATDKK